MAPISRTSGEEGLIPLSLPVRKIIFLLLAALCLTPFMTAPVALLMGLVVAQVIGNPFTPVLKEYKITQRLLQYSVVGLGFGMNIHSAIAAGKQGVLFTIITIAGTLILGALLGMLLKIDRKTSHLVSSGTAICGGSAIAAVAPVIRADDRQISVALGIVFILNAIALFIFPPIGHQLGMSQVQFGTWAAIAIHDTSSVVGAAKAYEKWGTGALEAATIIKLARALWIIPLALLTTFFFKEGKQKIKIPWFIAFFIGAMLLNTFIPALDEPLPGGAPSVSDILVRIAKAGLVLTLFLIGAGLSRKTIRSVGFRPLLQGVLLWVTIAAGSLFFILHTVG